MIVQSTYNLKCKKTNLYIQDIKKILFVMNIHNKKYYINNIGFTFLL